MATLPPMPHPYLALEHPIRLAHRGSRLLWPENTMVAFRRVVEDLGYRYLEIDVRATADGIPVVIHDATLERTTNGVGAVADWAWEDLRRLDAGYRYGAEEDFPWRDRGARVPSLDEVYRELPDVHLNIDLKAPGIEWLVADVVYRNRAEDRTLVGSFVDRRISRFRRITRGRVATTAGPGTVAAMYLASRLGRTVRRPVEAYQLPYDHPVLRIDRWLVDAVHAAGAQLHLWTVNDPRDMARYLDLGVDGIVTDRPDLLNEVLEERGVR